MGRLTRIKNRHRIIKSQIDTLMTEDVGRTLFPRSFTRWLNNGVLTFNRQEGMYAFTRSPILQEDRLMEYVNSNPHSTTEQIAQALDIEERRCYIALMSLRSQGRDMNFLFYTDGKWSINDYVDMSFLYWNTEETSSEEISTEETETPSNGTLIELLARHIRDVFLAKENFEVVERKYNDAQQGLEEKKQIFKSHLEELDLI